MHAIIMSGMSANKEVEKKIKKLRIFDELLLIFGRNKISFKKPHDEKHYTLMLFEGIFDVHETIEGREKYDEKYPIEGREKYDPKKFSEVIIETMREELPHIQKEIDLSDPKYMNVEVLIIPKKEMSREFMQKVTTIKRKQMMIKESKLMDGMKDLIVPMKDLQNYDFKMAYLLKEGEVSSVLLRINRKYFVLMLNDIEVLIEKMLEKLMHARTG